MMVGDIDELLELRVGYWILVDPERLEMHRVVMEASRSILPRILHINPDIIEAFNLNAFNTELEVSLRNSHHVGRTRGWLGSGDGHDLLMHDLPLVRRTAE